MNVQMISVLLCTYNRASLLRETLQALQHLDPPPACHVELLVVDNNSTDATPEVIADAVREGPFRVRAFHEVQQGKSFALNHGLGAAGGDIIALTDDDVLPARDWLVRIARAFREHEGLTFTFGKVLPRWGCLPPPELLTRRAQDIWGPLAIVDYGDDDVAYEPQSHGLRLPIGANLAFAASALRTIGGWRTDLGKVNNSLISGEDHEIFVRLRRHDLYRGYYDPLNMVRHYVPPTRLTRQYFRQWFFWHGRTNALMLADLFPELDLQRTPSMGGVPRFLYRQAVSQFWRYTRTLGSRDGLALLIEELKALQYVGLLLGCWSRRVQREPLAAAGGTVAASSPRVR